MRVKLEKAMIGPEKTAICEFSKSSNAWMDPLLHLAIIWVAVFVGVVAAKKTRLTPALLAD